MRGSCKKGAAVLLCIILCAGCGKKTNNDISVIPVTTEIITTTEEITTQETTTEEITTQETTTEEITAQETTTEEITTQETTTEEITTQQVTTEEVTTTQEVTTEEITTQETTTEEITTQEETTTQQPTLSEEERQALLRQKVMQELPGIVCWGDSLTAGYGGNGESYPATLERLIAQRLIDGIPVVNNGVCVEQSYTIMARAGVWAIYAEGFTIPAECESVEVHLILEGGIYTNLTHFGDGGLNPVTIEGVKGILTPSHHEDEYGYVYFTRLEPGEAVEVPNMSLVHPVSKQAYDNYVNIIFMGENGIYDSADDLVRQHQRFIDVRKLDRYIIIGLTTGDNDSRGELSQKMAEHFGSNYIDMRTELVQRGPELAGVGRWADEAYYFEKGLVMGYLKSDDIHLNEYGYRAVGEIVYERMEALGYFDGVKNAIAAYQSQQ